VLPVGLLNGVCGEASATDSFPGHMDIRLSSSMLTANSHIDVWTPDMRLTDTIRSADEPRA